VAARTADAAMAAVKEIFPANRARRFRSGAKRPENLDVLLEGNIYQRHVILCGNTRLGGATSGLTSRLIRRGKEACAHHRSRSP